VSASPVAAEAARDAVRQAAGSLGGETPRLAVVFASVSYPDVADVGKVVREMLGDVPIIGGTSGGCVFGTDRVAPRGVSVVVIAGDDIEVAWRTATCSSPHCLEAVPAAEEIAREADAASRRGLPHYACLVFAPGISVDGEALVAAVRKGAGARAQLAGGLTGDDLTLDRPMIYVDDELRNDRVVIVGLYTRQPLGIAARHGWNAVGPVRTVTRTEDVWLCELDRKPALDVWLEDARRAGAKLPEDPKAIPLYLANHYELGIADAPPSPRAFPVDSDADQRELVARAPFAIREDGALKLSATLAEGTHVRVLHATTNDLLRASTEAAAAAALRAGSAIAGALVLACSGRLAALGEAFAEEPARIRDRIGAPIGGACVFGEIARNVRDADAFFNTTVVVVAFAG
jgi:hypothetical protein